MTDGARKAGLVGLFDSADELLAAARTVRDAGYQRWDCHTPYPIHGLDRAMGLPPSPIPYFTIGMGLVGASVAMLMQWWMSAVDYPIRIGGKPLFSWPAYVPITFELFVLFAAVTTIVVTTYLCRLWRWSSPLHESGVMADVVTSRFAIVLSADDQRYARDLAWKLLEKSGCLDIRDLEHSEERNLFG
jgi:hypothetical protein